MTKLKGTNAKRLDPDIVNTLADMDFNDLIEYYDKVALVYFLELKVGNPRQSQTSIASAIKFYSHYF